MAIAVIGGLVISTFLSLLVVPAFYIVADRLKNYLSKKMTRQPEKDDALEELSQT
jgi:predicted RND superfamily exporter protein